MAQTSTSKATDKPMVKDYGLYIDGHFVEPRSTARLPVYNPATGETWATISDASAR